LLLIRKRIIALFSTENDGASEAIMPEFAMRSFAARHHSKSGLLQIGDELADFAWHSIAIMSEARRAAQSAFCDCDDAQKRVYPENQRRSNGKI
jgi:hypothetical protein